MRAIGRIGDQLCDEDNLELFSLDESKRFVISAHTSIVPAAFPGGCKISHTTLRYDHG